MDTRFRSGSLRWILWAKGFFAGLSMAPHRSIAFPFASTPHHTNYAARGGHTTSAVCSLLVVLLLVLTRHVPDDRWMGWTDGRIDGVGF